MELASKKKYKIVTLGCRTNQYESQAYADQLQQIGYAEAGDEERADLCIINTCTVTASADSASRHHIRQMARNYPGSRIVVTGCLAERVPDAVRGIRGVSDVVSNAKKEDLLSLVFPEDRLPEFAIRQFEAHTRAFVKVQDGCNAFCTYCIIPYVRGRSRSRAIGDVVREVEGLVTSGYKEIVLTGINIGDYGQSPDGKEEACLADLVRIIDRVPGIKRLRLSSIDPDEVDENLQDAILAGKTTCPSLHIVLQSGSNVILKKMNRKYTRQIFLETIARLRELRSDFGFTTDVIVGFPGETEDDFSATLDVIRQVRFAKVHMFPYSERARTRAALYPDKILPAVIQERKQRLLRQAERDAYALRETFLGRSMEVLVEGQSGRDGYLSGHTGNFLHVLIPVGTAEPNTLVNVHIVQNTPEGLIGHVQIPHT